jgi:hypothetical protein
MPFLYIRGLISDVSVAEPQSLIYPAFNDLAKRYRHTLAKEEWPQVGGNAEVYFNDESDAELC